MLFSIEGDKLRSRVWQTNSLAALLLDVLRGPSRKCQRGFAPAGIFPAGPVRFAVYFRYAAGQAAVSAMVSCAAVQLVRRASPLWKPKCTQARVLAEGRVGAAAPT